MGLLGVIESFGRARIVIFILFSMLSWSAYAVPQIQTDQSGVLLGAKGVLVGETKYDVQFHDASCRDLYWPCESSADFVFRTEAEGTAAAQALLSQVLVDGPAGPFDSAVERIRGCEAWPQEEIYRVCIVLTPFGMLDQGVEVDPASRYLVLTGIAFNSNDQASDCQPPLESTCDSVSSWDWAPPNHPTTDLPAFTYAYWQRSSTPIPEPSSLLSIALLVCIGASHGVLPSGKSNKKRNATFGPAVDRSP